MSVAKLRKERRKMIFTKVIYKIGKDTYCCIVPDQTHEHIKECLNEARYELISLTDID